MESESGVTGAGAQGAAAICVVTNAAARDASSATEAREYLREEANKYAPNWGRLHLKWGEALYWTGDRPGAHKQFDIASHLDIDTVDAGTIARMRAMHG